MGKTWELTDEARKLIPEHNEYWRQIIVSTDRVNKQECIDAAKKMYAAAKLKEPKIGFVRSPVVGEYAAAALSMLWQLTRDAMDSELTNRNEIKAELITIISKRVNELIGQEAAMDVAEAIFTLSPEMPDTTPLTDGDKAQVLKVYREVLQKISGIRVGGNEWGAYDCYLTFVRDKLDFQCEEHKNYKHWENLAIHGGIRWVGDDYCLISDRPIAMSLNQANQLDNDKGPAKEYADGFKMWYIEGVEVDEQIVMKPETQTAQQILDEGNEEVRRIRIMRYGDGFFEETDTKELDRNVNDIEGTRETLLEVAGGMKFLRTFCPSEGKLFVLPVADEVRTCAEAQSWLWGIDDASTTIVGRT